MTRKRRSKQEAELVKMQLADIMQDVFDNNGQLVTHDQLAKRHVLRNGSLTASEDVHQYSGAAVAYLRREKQYAIVPVTQSLDDYTGDPSDEKTVTNAIAGLGAGGPRIGWYQPIDKDDWLWVYYIGHLAKAGLFAVYHAGQQVENNKQLNSSATRARIAARSIATLPKPPELTETKVLAARLDDQ